MIRVGLICVIALTCLFMSGGPVLADCTDVPAPGVYWRRCLQDGQDLRGVDLTGATLRDASFKRADLSDAILNDIEGQRAKFVSSIMQKTRLDRANLVRADLTNADLTGASLVGADLTSARFFGADLSRADLTGASLAGTDLLKAILAGATWIDGKTICAEHSVGQCHPVRAGHSISEAEPSG
jgi:Pentapeptide repeats (8 copies)